MQSTLKRCISFVLALVMVLSLLPGQAFATGTEDHDHDHALEQGSTTEPTSEEVESEEKEDETTEEAPAEDDSAAAEPSDLAKSMVERINSVLDTFGITAEMTDAEIKAAINAQPWSVQKPTISEISQIEAMAEDLADADAPYVLANADVETFVRFKEVFKPMFVVAKAAASGSHTPVTGVTVSVSGATDNSMKNGEVTVTAKGSGGIFGIGASAKTATIKIANDSGSKAKISFAWTASSVNQLKIDGTVYSGSSGSFEKVMEAAEQVTITITTAKNSTVNKLVMKNFAIAAVKESSKVTFQYDGSLGSITVAGNATAADAAVDITSAGAELKATAKNGGTFVGWIDAETHAILSKAATFTLEPADDMTVKAIFTKNACFIVNGNELYEDWNAALTAVASVSNKTIVLANSGTLPAGTYTIPSGVTLLIPYNDANTLCTTVPTTAETQYKDAPVKVYRTLTMAEGANIVVNGAMSLSATQTASGGQSSPIGNCSFVQMNSGSNITVNNGGKLYAWGYIQGSGSVTVKSGGTVYECFQVMDWRGGDNTSGMVGNDYRVFPMSQYYIQNVEVPMTLEAGATENGYMSVAVSLIGIQGAAVPFIGANGMFNIESGSIVKDYDENTGRLLIDVYGTVSVKSLSISMKLGLLGSSTINSKDYVLPINGNMTVTMRSGSSVTMTQDIALQPGAKLIIAEGATCTLGNGNKIYVYDYDQWTTEVAADAVQEGPSFCGTPDATHINLKYPASATTVQGRTDDAYVEVNGTVNTSAGFVYTTASGANIRGTGTIIMKPGTDTVTYQVKNTGSDNKTDKWVSIPITSAKLTNADGTVVETANNTGVVTYKSVDGIWTCQHAYAEKVTQEATCENSGIKTLTCNCGDSKTETIEKLQHEYVSVVTDPTCTAAGFTTHTCKNGCNDSYTDSPVAALGHTAGEAATCETAQTCTVCGAELVAALGHTAGAAATCETAQTCTVCGAELVAALGHSYEAVVTDPTCTAEGYTTHICAACGDSYVDSTVAANGHSYEAVVTDPTCTAEGYTTHTCAICGDSYVDSTVAALGHTWAWVTDKEATVLTPGVKHEECSVCQAKQNENTEIPVLACPHTDTLTGTAAKEETCTEVGNYAYWYCSACQNYYSDAAGQHEIEKDSWIISKKGHDYKAVITAPTCTAEGYTTHTCANCGDSYVDSTVATLGHSYNAVVTAPTCMVGGYTTYTCTVCGDSYVADQVNALGHSYIKEVTAPTCTEEGYTTYTCEHGDDTFVADKVAALGHTAVIDPEKKATCKATGLTEGSHCGVCTEVLVEQQVTEIDPDGHIWDEGEPYGNHSCNSASYIIYKCTLCKEQKRVVDEEKHFRIPIAEEIPATCTEDGMTSGWKCEKCHEFWIPQEVIPALGHDWNEKYPCENETSACTRCDLHFDSKQEHLVVVDPAVAATCTSTGLTEGAHCGYCGEILVAQTETPVIDHTFIVADMEIAARCGIVGHKEGGTYCIYCEYDEDPIPALEHKWMHRDAKKATYTVVGWNAHDYCLLCNTIKTLDEYENDPCEFCGDEPEGYMEVPKVEIQGNKTVADTLTNLEYLEQMAEVYAFQNPNADALGLVLNYLRTGVANYTSGSWAIMAGPEDTDFLKFVQDMEDTINNDPELNVWINVSGLKKLSALSNNYGELNVYRTDNTKAPMLSGHFFGTMDMTYHNKGSQNHADVGGWVGDLTDLLGTADEYGVPANLTLDEKVEYIRQKYLFNDSVAGSAGSYGSNDLYADLDAFYFCNELITNGYETGDLVKLMREYYQSGMTLNKRAAYLINNRLDGLSTRKDLRTAVYNAYTSNKLIATLEGTRNFKASGSELTELRKAVCYAFADEMCRLAGDYVEDLTNPRFTVFDTETKILAPGVSQQINYATNADGKQIVYYIATADVMRDDVGVWVNYYDRDPGTPEQPNWLNNAVPKSAQNAQDRYGDPNSPDYIENFNVIASTNAGGYDMSDTATPGGLMVMNGVEWFPESTNAGFFAILEDGTAYMGNPGEYQGMKDRIKEAVGGFGEFVVKDGVVTGNATYSDAPRTSVGITSTGRVVLMCIDGRQAPFSSGASLQDVGYIMKEAGCVVAINLDGGGSTTFVARQPGSDELTVMNRPSDGYPRNVSSNLLIYSTAPSSTAFDHAVVDSAYDYATIGTPVQMTAAGVSPSGSAVEIPEGATWAVANEDIASITEDGVFTGKRLGEVNVYLMLDGNEIGIKRMSVANPDQLYFEKNKVDAIYGSSVVLPLRARIEGKQIAINPNDVTITLGAPAAGSMDGFVFKAVESAFKNLAITASIEGSQASINVMLFKQGENSFDFENATGGTRQLAWHREVTNAKVEDGNIYNVIDPSKEMVASYTFALDMTTIPIPERLKELTYMLPGGTLEGATAWSFLLSLAQRISDLSWVKASIDFDDRFDVDYSELKILNEYFEQKGEVEFDEATNTLTVTMNWIKQSQVIDEATANPLCLISGIKLTPKAGAWDDVTKIEAVTSGTIGYELYMRASGLYGFAQKPENQAIFGLMPYRNPADTSDAGGFFRDTYAQITDTFTMVNVLKEGWVNEDGGFAYYIEGERLTGVKEVECFYYDFGENGINVGQTKYTGLFFDEDAKVYRYSYIGVLTSGWQMINDEWYYFDASTMAAVTGKRTISHVPYEFEENGKLKNGVWMNVFVGYRYYYGPDYVRKGWYQIDGNWYYFKDAFAVTGDQKIASQEISTTKRWYHFDENGVSCGKLTGIVSNEGKLYYVENGKETDKGLFQFEGDHYCTLYTGELIVNQRYYAWNIDSSSVLPKGHYDFGSDGKVLGAEIDEETGGVSGIVEMDGVLYYYENGKPTEKGMFKYNDAYYFSLYNGALVVNQKYYVWKHDVTSPFTSNGHYEFGPDGKLMDGIINKDGVLYYYELGKPADRGLFVLDGDYYFTLYNGQLVTDQIYYVWKHDSTSNLTNGHYEFGIDGKMLQGIVSKDGALTYYENGKTVAKGLFVYNDGYHYYAHTDGVLITGQSYYAWQVDSSSQLTQGTYEFGTDGRVIGSCITGEIISKNGILYYYEAGKPVDKGLFLFNGDYYCTLYTGELVANQKYYVWNHDITSALPNGHYEFDAEGKMLQGIVDKDGKLFYYEDGKPVDRGLFLYNGDYYFTLYTGELVVDQKYYVWKHDATSALTNGHYEFDAEGKMVQGIIDKDGKLFYYENGKPADRGLFLYNGDYYFTLYTGELIVDQKYYVWKHDPSSDFDNAHYLFDEEGRMIGSSETGEIVSIDGVLYYYEKGQAVDKGLFYLDGYYYFTLYNGQLVVNQSYYVWKDNEHLMPKNYLFNELGQIIG